ncbi:MAG: SRPBCC domain-containing protein [bacterium]|nr:SRPBCC domain-containing protein [bacterium]
MKYHINTSININANINTVWNTFTQFDDYPNWNSFIKSVQGNIQEGEKIKIEIDGSKFSPKVLSFKKEKELIWVGKPLMPGIFEGEHAFRFEENPDGTTTLLHEEHFRGILVPFMKKYLRTKAVDGFKHWNKTLKEKAEKR